MSIGEWIRTTREDKGLGKGAFAKRVGVTVGRLNQWESGRSEPRGEELDRLREALGAVPPSAPAPATAAEDDRAPETPTATTPLPAARGALTAAERAELLARLDAGQPLPEAWRNRLFPASSRTVEIGKEYRLEYQGKMKREAVLADTPAAPWQLVRRFCTDRPFDDGWRNLLVWGDNLLALRELLADQRGPNRYGTRDRIKLIYIDPPFATRQDLKMPDRGGYSFPHSYKPASADKTHAANEHFNPDDFLRVADRHDILVVEVKAEGDDSNRNRAKWRDGLKHFATLDKRLAAAEEPWRYHFYFLSPEDYPAFFDRVRRGEFVGWQLGLMQELLA